MWSDPAEIQRRMHLVAQRYSREFDESTAPEGREAVAGP
jgi:hypothetical protein